MTMMIAEHPLAAPPADAPALGAFLDHHAIPRDLSTEPLLMRIARAFAGMPYENLSKIIDADEQGAAGAWRCQTPARVLHDHQRWGTGGTCFALTAALLHLVRAVGLRAEPILADRRYGADTHCALLVWLDGHPCLLDPGYLITAPIPISAAAESTVVATPFHRLELQTESVGESVRLTTIRDGQRRARLTYKTQPVDEAAFIRAWQASFDWDMMNYPVLARVAGGRQLYLQENRLQERTASACRRNEWDPAALAALIEREFGIAPAVTCRALAIWRRQGAWHG